MGWRPVALASGDAIRRLLSGVTHRLFGCIRQLGEPQVERRPSLPASLQDGADIRATGSADVEFRRAQGKPVTLQKVLIFDIYRRRAVRIREALGAVETTETTVTGPRLDVRCTQIRREFEADVSAVTPALDSGPYCGRPT